MFVDCLMVAIAVVIFLCGIIIERLTRARDYWRRRAQFFETQAYSLLRNRPIFRHDDPADWWKE